MTFGEALFSDGSPKPILPSRESGDEQTSVTAGKRALIVEDEIMVAWHLESVLEDLQMEICGLGLHGTGSDRRSDKGQRRYRVHGREFGGAN